MERPGGLQRRAVLTGAVLAAASIGVGAVASKWHLTGAGLPQPHRGLRNILPLLPSTGPAQRQARYLMSLAEADITPGNGMPMSGYGWQPRTSNGHFARRLRAQCCVLTDSAGKTVVMVRVDAVALTHEVYRSIVDDLLVANLISGVADFMINVSHTHSGPAIGERPDPRILTGVSDHGLGKVRQCTDDFVRQIVDTVRRARAAEPVPVNLGYAQGKAEVASQRWVGRNAPGPTEVPVLVAQHAGTGQLQAVLYGYACHPVCRGNDRVFDSDFCGVSSAMVSERLGVPALFFQGAAGDVDPSGAGKGEARIGRVGHGLAQAVIDTVQAKVFRTVAGPMNTAIEEIQLPFARDLSDSRVVADLRSKYQARIAALHPGSDGPGATRRHAEFMVRLMQAGNLPTSIPMTLQRWRLGELTMLMMGHEVVSSYAAAARTRLRSGGALWTMGYTNQVECYVPGDYGLRAGGYAAGWTAETGRYFPANLGSLIAYKWPMPLRSSLDAAPGRPGAEEMVVASIERLLNVA